MVGPKLGDMRTVYHPNSGRPVSEHTSRHPGSAHGESARPILPDEPWKPFFNTREDFLLSEILLESGMNKGHSDRLLRLIQACISGKGKLTLSNYSEVQAAWQRASQKLTPFECETVSVPYQNEERMFEVHYRPLWGWAQDLLTNPQLAPHFEWDARKIFKHNGESFVCIIDEPWTGDAFWNAQMQLPEGASPFCLILYADKTKLSSFGTQKGYPVVVRCANLPAEIRNGEGIGGGCVVGWLPIVSDDPKELKKPAFVNFKRIVWHKAFYAILKSIIMHSKTGCWFQCADGAPPRWLFPLILILSADLEEQWFIALLRGIKGKLPCPICLVPGDRLADLSTTWELRISEDMQKAVNEARGMRTKCDAERLLSGLGMQDVDNVFWQVQNSDPHRALSFDRLHSNNSGLFGYHLWREFKYIVGAQYGRMGLAKVNAQFDMAPSWSGLTHFKDAITLSFSDGKSFEDLSKVVVFVSHNVIKQTDPEAWTLLRAIQSFSILDLYLSFEMHTDDTIDEGRQEIQTFDNPKDPENGSGKSSSVKNWNFPKFHALQHSFDDIVAKGVTRNYNTKPNEKMHGPLKKAYLMRTNFKDVGPQILKYNHYALVTALIRGMLDALERRRREDAIQESADDSDIDDASEPVVPPKCPSKVFDAINVTLRSQRSSISLATLEADGARGVHFHNFGTRLSAWLSRSIPIYEINVPPETLPVRLEPGYKVTEYQSLKAVFESKVDFKRYIDFVYCNPSFHGQKRYDFVIVQAEAGQCFFARLLFAFTCSIADTTLAICLVRPCEAASGTAARNAKDRQLKFCRVREKTSVEFIFARSIIRGAPLIESFERANEYLVMDVVDHAGDLFLRCKELFKQYVTIIRDPRSQT
ncbi:hypothetical protein BC834DRAFT_818216 [Gloeopeniophorella convolvens]|nr:hypothetical protein BC834DRAFT_818216 [Gloeopeniophorella convolvens]